MRLKILIVDNETPARRGLALLLSGLGYQFAVRLDKPGGFIGRETLLARKARGIQKRLAIFTLADAAALPWGDEPIPRDGELVGGVTSAAFGHTRGRAVAMGHVRHAGRVDPGFIESGRYEIAGERVGARAHRRAPYDPGNDRMRER